MAGSSGDVPFVYAVEEMFHGRRQWEDSFVENASRRCPENSAIPRMFGVDLYYRTRYSEAIEQLEEAEKRAIRYCERFPESPVPKKELEAIQIDLRDTRKLVQN